MEGGLKRYFGPELAERLATEITAVHPEFPAGDFLAEFAAHDLADLGLVARCDLLAATLRAHLPSAYPDALGVLLAILGPENPEETGMFTFGYWLWPVGSFIQHYGLDHHDRSIGAIEELTKRHTGEWAIRPYLVARPEPTQQVMLDWAGSDSFHVRRLASEGLRPRLPWAKRLTVFLDDPAPVFAVLERLKDDRSRFVQRSVANNLNDHLKETRPAAMGVLEAWADDPTPQRCWIVRHALRNEVERSAEDALELRSRVSS